MITHNRDHHCRLGIVRVPSRDSHYSCNVVSRTQTLTAQSMTKCDVITQHLSDVMIRRRKLLGSAELGMIQYALCR